MTLKTGLGVVQGHWKWRRSMLYDNPFVRHRECSSILWRWMISWPWNLG